MVHYRVDWRAVRYFRTRNPKDYQEQEGDNKVYCEGCMVSRGLTPSNPGVRLLRWNEPRDACSDCGVVPNEVKRSVWHRLFGE